MAAGHVFPTSIVERASHIWPRKGNPYVKFDQAVTSGGHNSTNPPHETLSQHRVVHHHHRHRHRMQKREDYCSMERAGGEVRQIVND